MKRILSVILTCSLVMGILCFDIPVSSADEVSVDTTDLLNILNQYYSDLSDSVINDIVSESPYFLFRDITFNGVVHYYQLDTFSADDLMLWHYQYDGRNLYFYQYVTNPAWYSFDFVNPSGLVGYTLSREKNETGNFNSSFVQRLVYNNNTGVVTPSDDANYNTSVYWYTFTSSVIVGSAPWRLGVEDITRILYTCSNVDCANTGYCQFESVIDDNFTDVSISGSVSEPALNISWAESIYNTSYTYGYSEIQLGIMFDNTISYVSFDSLDYPDYFPNGSNIYIPFDFIISISDISSNIESFSRVKLGEIILNQYAKFNPGDSLYAKFSSYSLANLILFSLGGSSYDDNYFQGLEPDNVFADRLTHLVPVVPTIYSYDYDGSSNIEEKYPDASAYASPLTADIGKYVPDWADLTCVSNYSQVDGNFTNDLFSFFDDLLDVYKNWDLYSSSVHSSSEPGAAFSQYCSDVYEQWYFTDVMMFCFFHRTTAWDPTRPQLNQCELIVWFLYTPRYYQKLSDMSIVNTFTDYSTQLNEIATASMNSFYNNYSLYTYVHAKLDDLQRNQINYFGTSTGLFNDLNDSIALIDAHLGDIVTYLSTIDDRLLSIDTSLAGTLSVADSAVLSLLGDILTAIGNIETGGGDVTVTDEESPYTFQVFFPYLEAFEGDSDSATVSDNLLPDNVKGFLDRHYQTIYTVYSGIFGSLYKVMDIDDTGNLDSNEMGTYRLAVDKFFNAVNLTYIDRSVEYSTGDNVPVNYYPDGFSRILRRSFDLTTMDGGQ